MAKIISTLDEAIEKINTLFEGDSTPPTVGEEDYEVWTSLLNTGINIWEMEEGMLWKELFVKLEDAPDGDKTTVAGQNSYDCPTLFQFPSGGFVWLGDGNQKTPYQVINQTQAGLLQNDQGNWCYFLMDRTPTLEFNKNLTLEGGLTISYEYYKYATSLVSASDVIEMSDPFFAVYYAVSELKKDEGDTSALTIATQKLEAMKTRNYMATDYQQDSLQDGLGEGFGY